MHDVILRVTDIKFKTWNYINIAILFIVMTNGIMSGMTMILQVNTVQVSLLM